ncbi:MAG: hypothetical protein Q4F97_11810 [Bacteroidales bacterium]|nr:hypothetical protein [Bacteroidales bacterium]
MDTKIQELTDKIFKEGVEKGNVQAQEILSDAKKKAAAVEAEAKAKAEEIITQAKKDALELKTNTISELQLYAGQAVEALKSEIATLVSDKLSENAVAQAMDDKSFMQQVILALVSEWGKKEDLVIDTEDASVLTSFFEAKAKELLNAGVKINQVNGLKSQFTISPADGSYKITFGEEEFVNYFKAFLRPQLVELLFSK